MLRYSHPFVELLGTPVFKPGLTTLPSFQTRLTPLSIGGIYQSVMTYIR